MEEDISEQMIHLSLPNDCLNEAQTILNCLEQQQEFDIQNDPDINILDKYKRFIWFALPKDILTMKINHLAIE